MMDIAKEIGMPALLGQTAEECMELSKAAQELKEIKVINLLDKLEGHCSDLAKKLLKCQRILMGTNPTPISEDDALDDLMEEATDLKDCLTLLQKAGVDTWDPVQSHQKMQRWEQRIREAKDKANG